MDGAVVILAWAVAIAAVFLIADTIAADLANRRAERIAARHVDRAHATQRYRR